MDRPRPFIFQREPEADDRHAGTEAAAENHEQQSKVVDPNEPTPNYSTQRRSIGRVLLEASEASEASEGNLGPQLNKYSVVIVAGEGADPDEQSQAAAHHHRQQ
ncbi:hypothetical protein V493_01042 [Pseudogymnoascus sp. VKM F-4281 (FW-2241)]|nr:hypothetical protein V493_01042 [Pseudogymnoascus sp. VKM F-4281 (FW-2241)]